MYSKQKWIAKSSASCMFCLKKLKKAFILPHEQTNFLIKSKSYKYFSYNMKFGISCGIVF